MNKPDSEQELLAFVKQHLDQSLLHLDGETQSRLRIARRRALRGQPKQHPWVWPAWGLTAACALVLALALWVGFPVGSNSVPMLEDVELLASADSLDFYEDMDFYGWLAEYDPAG